MSAPQPNVQWNLEGGSITDLSSNSSPSYFNFDSFEQIQVTTGGGDVSVQSSGLSINLVTKSGSNVFKGTAVATFENDATQGDNVTQELFDAGTNGFLSGNPIKKIANYSVEYGGPIMKNRLWFWAAADKQDINAGVVNFFDAEQGIVLPGPGHGAEGGIRGAAPGGDLRQARDVQNCLSNDKTVIKDLQWKFNYQLNAANKFQYLFQSDNKYRNAPRRQRRRRRRKRRRSRRRDKPWGFPLPTHSLTHTFIAHDKLVFNNQFTYVHGGFFLDYQDVPPQGACAAEPLHRHPTQRVHRRDAELPVEHPAALTTDDDGCARAGRCAATYQTTRQSWEAKTDGTYFLTNTLGGDHSLKFGLGWRRNPIQTLLALQRRRARARPVRRQHSRQLRRRQLRGRSARRAGLVPVPGGALSRPAAEQRLVDLQRLHPGRLQPRPVAPERRPPLRLAAVEVPGRLRAGQRRFGRTCCRRSARIDRPPM